VLQSTFIHAPGVGALTEQTLWRRGAHTWYGFLEQHALGGWRGRRYDRLAQTIEESHSALERRDVTFFSRRLSPGDQWRLYPAFRDRVAYVDIETTGLFMQWDEITVVALYDGESTRTFIRGKNLQSFPETVARYSLLVTFNGAQFDVPFLRAAFDGLRVPPAHIDLRFALRRLGYSGGLKAIERKIGLSRPDHLREIDGAAAPYLWQRYCRGDAAALETLVEYAAQDVKSLEPLADHACLGLAAALGMPMSERPL
jgi:uncharacterized protein YprB with RNaseH-like and TPR domain